MASTKAVYVLVPLPLERQIQDLLASHRVEEALTLTEGARRNIPKDRFQVLANAHEKVMEGLSLDEACFLSWICLYL